MSHILRRLGHIARSHVRFMSSTEKLVNVEVNENTGVATVTMQRLPVNSLNLDLLSQLRDTLDQLEKNRSRGMILTSASPTVFSAGLDILEMYKKKTTDERMAQFWSTLQDVWLKLYGSSFPTVAAINGHSPAGGCLLAASCEYRVMVTGKFTIGLNETKLGIVAPTWFMDSMNGIIGTRRTELALTTGKLFTVDEAVKIGLIDETAADKTEAIAKSEKWLSQFDEISPAARNLTKQAFRQGPILRLQKNRDADLKAFLGVVNQPKVQQGLELYILSLKNK